MKILVTGSKGYLGKPLTEKLRQTHQIVDYDIVDGKDILNYDQLKEAMKGSEIVIHTAAIPKPDETKTFDDYFQVNCVGTLNVVKAAVENRVKKLIYISSTAYYSCEREVPIKFPLKEDQKTASMYLKADDCEYKDFNLAYCGSKVIAENILVFYGFSKKIEIIILRFPRIGDKDGPYGTKVSMNNAIQGIEKSISSGKVLWYEAFNISDRMDKIDISKAQRILGYEPE